MKNYERHIELLSQPLNSDVDHLKVLNDIYNNYDWRKNKLSLLMTYYFNGLDDIPTLNEKQLWNEIAFEKSRESFINSYIELLEILQENYNSFKFNFKIIESVKLNALSFTEYPIWSEYYDYEELYEIESWGLDRSLTLQKLQKKLIDQAHPYYTCPIGSFPLERMRYFTKSKFTTLNGIVLDGAIMNDGQLVIIIFINDKIEILNRNPILKSEMMKSMKKISEHFNIEISNFNKLEFETVVPYKKQNRIKGTWQF